MSLYTVRSLAAFGALVVAFAAPVESQACWLFGHGGQTTYRPWWGSYTPVAQPVAVAPAPLPCCPQPQPQPQPLPCCPQPQTCCFAPQTSFRPMIESVPVTTFMPVTSTNPCTGCPVTVMKPVTSFVQQTRMVPVTTFSPVMAAPSCSTCSTATTASFAPPASSCSTCNSGATTAFFVQPAAPAANCCTPIPTVPSTPTPAAAPTLEGTSIPSPASVGRTFAPQNSPNANPIQAPLRAIIPADNTKEKEETSPQLLDPNNKTAAAMPTQRGRGYIPVGRPARWESEVDDAPAANAAPTIDNDGWRAASH